MDSCCGAWEGEHQQYARVWRDVGVVCVWWVVTLLWQGRQVASWPLQVRCERWISLWE